MSARVEAAAKELNGYTGDCRCHEGYTSRRLIDPDCCYHEVPNHEAAVDMLKAADSVMFSEAAIERAARHFYTEFEAQPIYDEVSETFTGHRLWEWLTPEHQERYRSQIRAVVAALREEA